jgi:murein DD-endopeptidase MepM/ murein hydrolase activator NlpD
MSVIPAALLAAGFVFGASSFAEAKQTRHSKSASKHATHGKKKAARRQARVQTNVDRVAVVTAEVYGPFRPVEVYDYPRPLCSEHDAVAQAYLHDNKEEGPEPDFTVAELEEVVVPPPAGPIARVARTLGSLLRPKSAESTVRPEDVDLSDLLSAGVQIPVEGVDASRLKDSFLNSRGRHRQHLAIDIGAPKGTPVLAAADGEITTLRREKRGGISLYQKDATGKYLLFYCHLSRYVKGLRPGHKVSKGEVIAYVGRTGHVIGGPHLHFSITRLPEEDDNFRAGVAVNPYLLFLAAVP